MKKNVKSTKVVQDQTAKIIKKKQLERLKGGFVIEDDIM